MGTPNRPTRMTLLRELSDLEADLKNAFADVNGNWEQIQETEIWAEFSAKLLILRAYEQDKYGFPFTYIQWGQIDLPNGAIEYIADLRNTHTPSKKEMKFNKRVQALRDIGFQMNYLGSGFSKCMFNEEDPLDKLLVKLWYDKFVRAGVRPLEMDEDGVPFDSIIEEVYGNENPLLGGSLLSEDEINEIRERMPAMNPFASSGGGASRNKKETIEDFGRDLNKAALEGLLDPLVGRDKELITMEMILSRRKKNNPVLTGKAGVGKSQIVYGLAHKIAQPDYDGPLKGKTIMEISITKLMSGGEMKFVGAVADRMNKIIEAVSGTDTIIFIDELHTMMGAGASQNNENGDIGNMLKPYLADGRLTMIGATTDNEYAHITKDPAMERRFNKVLIEELGREQTIEVLKNIAPIYQEHHGIRYTQECIAALATVGKSYNPKRVNPDIAVDLMDSVASFGRMKGREVISMTTLKQMMFELYGKENIVTDRILQPPTIGFNNHR